MTFAKHPPKHDYRSYLSEAEAAELKKLEDEAARIDRRRRKVSADIRIIRNRAMQRALLAKRRIATAHAEGRLL